MRRVLVAFCMLVGSLSLAEFPGMGGYSSPGYSGPSYSGGGYSTPNYSGYSSYPSFPSSSYGGYSGGCTSCSRPNYSTAGISIRVTAVPIYRPTNQCGGVTPCGGHYTNPIPYAPNYGMPQYPGYRPVMASPCSHYHGPNFKGNCGHKGRCRNKRCGRRGRGFRFHFSGPRIAFGFGW